MVEGLSTEEFDQEAFAELRDDLGEAFGDFVAQFVQTARGALDNIDMLLRCGDAPRARAQAHSLLGTAGYVGALAMGEALELLQQELKRGDDFAKAQVHASQARAAFARLESHVFAMR